ncbi:hypothetical protein [uncultured Deinococcus sp.]|uniref:hypothetical protein n=1 Tax=uncultured Deinococcus sp. TaxID=158789 RepID=UPI00258DE313|nr:hypothetical protein [uncultured Deinococcus sp.]
MQTGSSYYRTTFKGCIAQDIPATIIELFATLINELQDQGAAGPITAVSHNVVEVSQGNFLVTVIVVKE